MKHISFFASVLLLLLLGAGCLQKQPEPSSIAVDPSPNNVDTDVSVVDDPLETTSTEPQEIDEETEKEDSVIFEDKDAKDVGEKKEESTSIVLPVLEKQTVPEVKIFAITARTWDFEPATISVKKGDLVTLHITSVDVEHGFVLSAYGINETLPPNSTKTVEFTADKVGTFKFSCSVFCGTGHSDMNGTLIVTE